MRKFGVLLDNPKVADYTGEFRAKSVELPSKFILDDKYIPDNRDQGTVGSCVAFAITNIMQILEWKETGNRTRFSAGYFYAVGREKEDVYTGMFPRRALDYLVKTGSCFEEDFPYNYEMPEIRNLADENPHLKEKAYPYRIKGYEIFNSADKEKKHRAIKEALYVNNIPILTDTNYFVGGWHEVCIIGWDDEQGVWYIMNSWGNRNGLKGRERIKMNSVKWGYLLVDEKNKELLMPFEDVSEDKWYYKAVEKVFNAGLMSGTGETTFEPERNMTRAEVAQVLANLTKKIDAVYGKEERTGSVMNGLKERLKSIPLWTAILALVYLVATNWFGVEIPAWADISTQIIAVLTIIFGVANNPTNKSGF